MSNLYRIIGILFSLFVISLSYSAYVDTHDSHLASFSNFKYFGYLLFAQIFGIVVFSVVHFLNSTRLKKLFFTPTCMIIICVIITLPVFYAFDGTIGQQISWIQLISVGLRLFLINLFLLLIYYLSTIFNTAKLATGLQKIILFNSASGFSLIIIFLYILGILNFLQSPILIASFVIIAIFNLKSITKKSIYLWTPIPDHQNINYWGFIIFYLLLIALTINFLSILTPYPYGFDARNYYMNSTQLIAQNNGLIEGFQPYNWQLLMSLGFILFDSHEVAISISFFAFILCLIAINDFTKDIFKLDINYRLLIMLLITVTPAFYNQLSIDVKIDFALLFYQIVIVHLFVKLCQAKDWDWKMIIIFGLLNGFALGIKFTHLYLIASMIIVYWGIKGGVVGLISGASLCVGVFLIAKIDDVGGLRQYHLGVDYQQWIVLAIGGGLFVVLALTERQKWLKLMRFSVLFGAIAIIPMLPWMGKNYLETKSLSPKTLLMGKAPGYKMNLNTFIKNYEAKN